VPGGDEETCKALCWVIRFPVRSLRLGPKPISTKLCRAVWPFGLLDYSAARISLVITFWSLLLGVQVHFAPLWPHSLRFCHRGSRFPVRSLHSGVQAPFGAPAAFFPLWTAISGFCSGVTKLGPESGIFCQFARRASRPSGWRTQLFLRLALLVSIEY